MVACVLVPLGWNWPRRITQRFVPDVLWPARKDMIIVVIASLIIDVLDNMFKNDMPDGIRLSEVQELVLAYVMLLYAAQLFERIHLQRA